MNIKRMSIFLLIPLIILFVGIILYFFSNRTRDSFPANEILLNAPEKLEIRGGEYVLATYLWRDFMPAYVADGTETSGSSLGASIEIKDQKKGNISSAIDATHVWIVNDGQVWETDFSDEKRPPTSSDVLEKIAFGGPEWDIGITVDVIVRIVDLKSGKEYLLRAEDQEIFATS